MQSSAADIFMSNLLQKSPEERFVYISSFVGNHEKGEDELIEYKTGAPKPEVIPRLWAESLSGFGNAGGGILIWGIYAPKNVAKEIVLVQDVHALEARLWQLIPSSVEPPVSGVQIECIPEPGSTNGFVICKIPESRWKPHQIRCSKIYYYRIGDNLLPAGHSLVQALFNSRREARFELMWQLEEDHGNVIFRCWLKNRGPVSAYDMHVQLFQGKTFGVMIVPPRDFWEVQAPGMAQIAAARRPMHVGQEWILIDHRICHISELQTALTSWLRLIVYAKDQEPTQFRVNVEATHLKKGLMYVHPDEPAC